MIGQEMYGRETQVRENLGPDSCVVLNGLVRNVRREGGLISLVRQ